MVNVLDHKPVVIIGGGIAGLTAANYLKGQGVPVILYEAGQKIAGMAQSVHDDEGFTYDFGAHFITNRLAQAVGISADCRIVPRYRETVWLGEKSYSYPFGLMRQPKYVESALKSRLRPTQNGNVESAADWFRGKYGRAVADDVAIPLVEAWSGAAAEQLAPAVADSIPGSIVRTLWLTLASRLSGRAVACGYSRELPEQASVWHVYPHGGIATLCEKLAENLSDTVQLESPVEEIIVADEHIAGVTVNGSFQAASAVVSTAPVHLLSGLVKGTSTLDFLARFRFRPMVFVNLRLEGRNLLPDIVTWTPESRFPFFRLTETTRSMPWLAPDGKAIITVDIGCEVGDTTWAMEDDVLGEYCVNHLQPIVPEIRQRYLGCRVLRTPIAYPIFLREYELDRQHFAMGTGVNGLYSIGRNGEFRHMFMEDVYCRTRQKMTHITALHREGLLAGCCDIRGVSYT